MGSLNLIFIIILSLIINQFAIHLPIVKAKDVLTPGDEINSLDPNSKLLSAGGSCTLGFFTISSTNLTYLGIQFTNDDRKVWIANRDIPMKSNGVLMIDESGILKVVIKGDNNTNTTLFNVSNGAVGSGNTRAVLKDSGNFVLYDFVNGNRTLWQSFDHPTDTFLHGMRLGYNLTTGQNWTLTSWLSDQIPASGAFTFTFEQYQNSPQQVIYRRGKVYWSSGAWEDDRLEFKNVHAHYKKFGIADIFSDASGMYITVKISGIEFVSMTHLSPKGEMIDEGNNLITPTFCYGYQTQSDDGCAIFPLPSCRGRNDSFRLENGNWEGGLIQYDGSSKIGMSDCMERCWNDCNCKGFSTQDNGTGCYTWGRNAVFILDSSKLTQSGVLISYKPPKKKTWIWILISVAILLTSTLAISLCYVRIRRRWVEEEEKRRIDECINQLTGSASFNYGDELVKNIKEAPDVKIYSLKAILTATNNFSYENKLGHGGYGPVYKGKLFDGRQIAVKRLSKTSGQGIQEFKNELILISKLQHTNLVRLYGCCIHQEEKMLIYEYMPHKSLDCFLFAEDKKKIIDWRMRYNIIEGVAQGLLYLHKYSRMRVIHRDLKVSNILLDENMNPKIADFGIARIFQNNVTEAKTNRVVGTYGYMAPEYAMKGNFSIKSDVFSFGVFIIEIISGKMNSSFSSLDKTLNLLGYAWELWKGGTSLELKDESLDESCDVEQLRKTIHVGLLCVQEFAVDRPTMSEVIFMLNNEITDLPSPKQPGYFTGTPLVQSTNDSLDQNFPVSVSGLTITMMEAR